VIIPFDKLVEYDDNRYILTNVAISTVDKIPNMENYPEKNHSWKVVPNVLKIVLNEDIKFESVSKKGAES